MHIVITGGNGFIARNLTLRLRELGHDDISIVTRATTDAVRCNAIASADFIFHLAGVNRPLTAAGYAENVDVTQSMVNVLRAIGRSAPVAFASSTQATLDNPYGRSKRAAETVLSRYADETGAPVAVMRLTNVFGKWARPDYNSAVATFCHNIARGLPIAIRDECSELRLVYIDDVMHAMVKLLTETPSGLVDVGPVYETTVGEVATLIRDMAASRDTLVTPPVGSGLARALHATYLSYLPPSAFSYSLQRHADARGVFVEMLKTGDSGQISYFTAGPGVTRGGHYHHTKAEKFLVVAGRARFGFRHMASDETFEMIVDSSESRVVETVPGWAHDVTNVGDGDMLVLLWASEIFDPARPDTIAAAVRP